MGLGGRGRPRALRAAGAAAGARRPRQGPSGPRGPSAHASRARRPPPQDPANLDRVWVLFGGGGLWRTDNFYSTLRYKPDGRPSWRPLTDDQPGTNGGAVAFGKTSDDLYLALGDFDSSLIPDVNAASSVSGILLKSTNGGDSWSAPVIIDPDVSVVW